KKALDNFARTAKCIASKPSGRGVVYEVTSADLFYLQFRRLSPQDTAELDDTLPVRAANIATARNSKSAGHRHAVQYVLLKAANGPVSWRNGNNETLDLSAATQAQGISALAIEADNTWRTDSALWLVENQALFDRTDWLPRDHPATVIWYSGNLTSVMLDWLSEIRRASQIWHFPDYDGIGLMNFCRLRERLGEQADFWLFPQWQALLKRYGNNAIWQSNLSEFNAASMRLKQCLPADHPLHELTARMSELGMGLEQEAVWLAVAG
ncbi:MAG: hypothetical protein WED11_01605, partial [Natronospirillum sp.]